MNTWVLLLINVAVGSIIGGATNELAIRMLFRPYKEWRIGSLRVPFTPGLIPRRRDEIGVQMGRLVEEHLLTTEGIKRAIAKGDMENTLRRWLSQLAEEQLQSDQTIRQLLQRWWPNLFTTEGEWSRAAREPVLTQWRRLTSNLLSQAEGKTLRDLMPVELVQKLDDTAHSFSTLLLNRFRDYLHSQEGLNTIQNVLKGLLGGGGGMFGGLVGMFLGDDKIISKLLPYLDEALGDPELSAKLAAFLRHEMEKFLDKPLNEVVAFIGDEQIERIQLQLFAKLEEQSLRFADKPVSYLLERFRPQLLEQLIPRFSGWVMKMLEKNVENVFDKLAIREIVAKQVEGFPLERIEEMIIGISGNEFRMITVLGFVLGGIIGLVQGAILLLV